MSGLGFRRWFAPWSAVVMLAAVAISASQATAQDGFFQPIELGAGVPTAPVVTPTAVFKAPADGKLGRIYVTAQMTPGWHIYSLTQPDGGPVRTSIKITPTAGVTVGAFTADEAPHSAKEAAFDNLLVETHEGSVTWSAPLDLAAGVDAAKLELSGKVYAQACENVCLPPQDYKFTAKLGTPPKLKNPPVDMPQPIAQPVPKGPPPVEVANNGPPIPSVMNGPPTPGGPPLPGSVVPGSVVPGGTLPGGMEKFLGAAGSEGVYKPKTSKLKIEAKLEPSVVTPGGKARLVVTMTPDPQWHVYYAIASPLPAIGNQATSLVFTETSGLQGGFLATEQKPVTAHVGEAASIPYFEQPVTWNAEVDVPSDAKAGDYPLAGTLGFQTCQGSNCLQPEAVKWEAMLTVAPAAPAGVVSRPMLFVGPESYRAHAKAFNEQLQKITPAATPTDYDLAQIKSQEQDQASSLPVMIVFAMLAGFILNFMPCVLPVIGLKVLSFVEQGGHNPRRIFLLNLWYSLGMIFVFVVLATIPVVLRIFFNQTFGWGQQFSYDGFNITLIAIVFVMALSFLGVWEIPIPGFADSKKAQNATSQEGFFGAFAKGAVTTVLATPCSGPFLGTAVAFALQESAPITYAIFIAMGVGMASPYLLVGLRPGLIRFLPKPGEWMDTFKQIMGFVLIGTMLWLMVPIAPANLLPTATLLAGLAVACWWIGRTPNYAEFHEKVKAWGIGAAVAAAIGWFAFAAPQVNDPLPWNHNFAMGNFVREVDQGKTVMIEFTAKWCLTCKTLKAANLDRSTTKNRVEANGVVTYEVDIDELPEMEKEFFKKLQPSGGVPLIAIFPAEKKYEPILFGGGYTQSQILSALEDAGPSKKQPPAGPQVSMR
ncbi:MAG: hypothetical protein C0483_09355 [Pirellula sp.]|nr:hypothetical protein [Pirellula sp.]